MMLAAHDLAVGYPDRVVGRGLDLVLREGEVLALLGPNGGGKTTLLRTLLGLLPPRGGEVRLDDKPLSALSPRERARRIAYVPQVHVGTFAFTTTCSARRAGATVRSPRRRSNGSASPIWRSVPTR
jgi:iron complex transport system ATP-binding protein